MLARRALWRCRHRGHHLAAAFDPNPPPPPLVIWLAQLLGRPTAEIFHVNIKASSLLVINGDVVALLSIHAGAGASKRERLAIRGYDSGTG